METKKVSVVKQGFFIGTAIQVRILFPESGWCNGITLSVSLCLIFLPYLHHITNGVNPFVERCG